ncbi:MULTISPECIES: dihydrofolate reductase family protein [unclassified Lactococcus]|uniref:dihydrofolate reductase family protein n=1 Tax=unclassified Lactococcus TaxID=2643510 RepID=UPI0011C8CE30|nr:MULTISPECIES: dihydrofolate reductase family protein [unclassified Lactococcus]MQW22716.1 hypothetical protein [Lactococcus sp. dk101]TXK44723.1 dihydrofolate reductase [Lactococcus sp. dk310]TXK50617.1 dihydrofolate reductase [Lactococcus sp. dk322]
MKVTMVMVSSIDGVVSRHSEESVKAWTSEEDQRHLAVLVNHCDAVITGRKSFTKKIAPVPYYVFSRQQKSSPKDNQNQVFYTQEKPSQLLVRLEKAIDNVLLLGGPEINSLFLKENLVDELILTLEPKLFGAGKHLVQEEIEQDLELVEVQQLNSQGTLLVKYKIKKTVE